jgi:hypothetical protein
MSTVEKLLFAPIPPLVQFDAWKFRLKPMMQKKRWELFEKECELTQSYLEWGFPRLVTPSTFDNVVLIPKPIWIKRASGESVVGRLQNKLLRRSAEWRWYTRSLSFVNGLIRQDLAKIKVSLHNHLIGDPWVTNEDAATSEREELHRFLTLRQSTEEAFDTLADTQTGAFWVIPTSYVTLPDTRLPSDVVKVASVNTFHAPILLGTCMIWSHLNATSMLSDLEVLVEDFSIKIHFLGDEYTRQVDREDDERHATAITWVSNALKVGALRERRLWIDEPTQVYPITGYIPQSRTYN